MKSNIYNKKRRTRPVCRPDWIMDCVEAGKLLPLESYLLPDFKNDIKCQKYFFGECLKDFFGGYQPKTDVEMIKDAKTHLSKYFSNNNPTNHIIDQKLKSTGHHPVLNHRQILQFEEKTLSGGRSINNKQ